MVAAAMGVVAAALGSPPFGFWMEAIVVVAELIACPELVVGVAGQLLVLYTYVGIEVTDEFALAWGLGL